jgi:hypothetical protein
VPAAFTVEPFDQRVAPRRGRRIGQLFGEQWRRGRAAQHRDQRVGVDIGGRLRQRDGAVVHDRLQPLPGQVVAIGGDGMAWVTVRAGPARQPLRQHRFPRCRRPFLQQRGVGIVERGAAQHGDTRAGVGPAGRCRRVHEEVAGWRAAGDARGDFVTHPAVAAALEAERGQGRFVGAGL